MEIVIKIGTTCF